MGGMLSLMRGPDNLFVPQFLAIWREAIEEYILKEAPDLLQGSSPPSSADLHASPRSGHDELCCRRQSTFAEVIQQNILDQLYAQYAQLNQGSHDQFLRSWKSLSASGADFTKLQIWDAEVP